MFFKGYKSAITNEEFENKYPPFTKIYEVDPLDLTEARLMFLSNLGIVTPLHHLYLTKLETFVKGEDTHYIYIQLIDEGESIRLLLNAYVNLTEEGKCENWRKVETAKSKKEVVDMTGWMSQILVELKRLLRDD